MTAENSEFHQRRAGLGCGQKRPVTPSLKLVPAPEAYDGISRPNSWM
jgi:hypothetical protein